MVDFIEYRRALERIAKRSGASCEEVKKSYREAVKNSTASAFSLFLMNSVITLNETEPVYRYDRRGLPTISANMINKKR